jgi:hypothetical protein
MYRRLAVIAVSVSAVSAVFAFPHNANAAAAVPIRTYLEHAGVNFTGIGSGAGYYSKISDDEKVILSPRLALSSSWRSSYDRNGVHRSAGQADIAGDRRYTRKGTGRWLASTLSSQALAAYARELNPYVTLSEFGALRGIRHAGPGHYRVTGAYAQTGSFLAWEFSLTAKSFKGSGIKILTIDMMLDSSGRPVRITAAGRSATEVFTASETFANYNKPVTITGR